MRMPDKKYVLWAQLTEDGHITETVRGSTDSKVLATWNWAKVKEAMRELDEVPG
jgi:hypothetical protein